MRVWSKPTDFLISEFTFGGNCRFLENNLPLSDNKLRFKQNKTPISNNWMSLWNEKISVITLSGLNVEKYAIIEVTLLINSSAHKKSLSLWCVVLITFAISHYQEQKLDRHWFILCALGENRAEKSDIFFIYGFIYSNSYRLSEPWVMVLFSSCKA